MPSTNTDSFQGWALTGSRFAYALLLAVGAFLCAALTLSAQTADPQPTEDANKSWTATTDLNRNHINPERIIESHSQNGNRTLDEQSVQFRGFDGHFETYQHIETETVQVDAYTVRTTTRTFSRNANDRETLVQVAEQEKKTVPGGDPKTVRITSRSDLNGKLQPFQREIVQTKSMGTGTEETHATEMLPSINGGFAPASETHELRKRSTNDTMEAQKSTLVLDGNGKFQISEIRQNTTWQDANNRSIEEHIFRYDSEGKLNEISRLVSKASESIPGQKREQLEEYSVNRPGITSDGSLHLVERATTDQNTGAGGEQITRQRIDQPAPGDPGSGLRVSISLDDAVRPGRSGLQAMRTIRMRDGNGSVGVIEVDTTNSDEVLTIQVQERPSEQPK